MAKEIERKFLVKDGGWPRESATKYRQGYLNRSKSRSVRVRIGNDRAFLTIKGPSRGATRSEFEYEIPIADAGIILEELCEQPVIEKTRYEIEYGGMVWEVDEFYGANAGLVVAEIELEHEDQPFEKPDWVGEEVTEDPRYFNANLSKRPYSEWGRG